MLRCAVLDDYQDVSRTMADWSALADRVAVTVFTEPMTDRLALPKALEPFDIVVAMRERTPFDQALFAKLHRLKLLVTTGMRNASIDLDAAATAGVTVCGTEGYASSTAELTWGLILALMRRIPQENALFHTGGRWQTSLGRDLRGLKLGIIGYGKLGARVARFGHAFEMQVGAWSR